MRRITESFTRRVLRLQTRRGVAAADTARIPTPVPEAPPPAAESQAVRTLSRAEEASGRFALAAWDAFWADFRPDEQDVEMGHYRTECADLQTRLDALPPGGLPDAHLSSAILRRVMRLRRDRYLDLSDRIDDLASSHHQATGRYEKAALNGAQLADDNERSRRRILALLARHGIQAPADDPLPLLLERLVETLSEPGAPRASARLARVSRRRPAV
jgi:hypothetical protein